MKMSPSKTTKQPRHVGTNVSQKVPHNSRIRRRRIEDT